MDLDITSVGSCVWRWQLLSRDTASSGWSNGPCIDRSVRIGDFVDLSYIIIYPKQDKTGNFHKLRKLKLVHKGKTFQTSTSQSSCRHLFTKSHWTNSYESGIQICQYGWSKPRHFTYVKFVIRSLRSHFILLYVQRDYKHRARHRNGLHAKQRCPFWIRRCSIEES